MSTPPAFAMSEDGPAQDQAPPLQEALLVGEWARFAACINADPDMFFQERGQSTAPAKAICRTCPVQGDCLEHAIRAGEKFGIWGGRSERERRRMRKYRRPEPRGQAIA